ncbi:hypothetical protein [Lactobacillus corticis]|uniref:Uncharacterized protein n=1 Tax=Lactobacillus corticis TaxID=2201249 RepID=A0A916VHA9_9LACO|nr:hypothetical protein [Lactobacillus corticis]GFZ26851.1 hypothetical protein LCB40_07310 [Lactobacillus corticis]
MISTQIFRLLKRWQFWLAEAIGIGVVVIQAKTISNSNANFINSAYVHLTGFDYSGLGSRLYYLIVPLMCGLVAGSTYKEDKQDNMLEIIASKSSFSRYLRSVVISSFLVAGMVAVIPLIIEGIYFFTKYSTNPLPANYELTPISKVGWGYHLFLSNPILFWLLCLGILFVFAGFFGLIALAASAFNLKYGLEALVPFIFCFVLLLLRDITGNEGISVVSILTPTFSNDYPNLLGWIIGYALIFVLGLFFFFRRWGQHDLLN